MSTPDREQIQAYLLGLLAPEEAAALEARFDDPAWARAVEEERAALATLDGLPDIAPLPTLDAAILERVRRGPSWRNRLPASIAVAAAALLAIGAFAIAFRQFDQARRVALAENNLRQIGLALKMYSNESRGERLPPISPYEGVWLFDVSTLYPDYLSDLGVLAAPAAPGFRERLDRLRELQAQEPIDWEAVSRIAADHFVYTGYSLQEPEELLHLATTGVWTERDSDLEVEGDRTIYRLREGIERFFITDINNPAGSAQAQSLIPVLVERHDGAPTQSLFLDGVVRDASGSPLIQSIAALPESTP